MNGNDYDMRAQLWGSPLDRFEGWMLGECTPMTDVPSLVQLCRDAAISPPAVERVIHAVETAGHAQAWWQAAERRLLDARDWLEPAPGVHPHGDVPSLLLDLLAIVEADRLDDVNAAIYHARWAYAANPACVSWTILLGHDDRFDPSGHMAATPIR